MMMYSENSMASNDDILRALGHIEGKIEAIDDRLQRFESEFSQERRSSSDSRSRIHERIDEQSLRIAEAEKTIVISGSIVAQQRDVVAGLAKSIDDDIKPTIEHVNDITRLGKTASIIFVGMGFTVGGFALATWDAVRPWLGKLLRG